MKAALPDTKCAWVNIRNVISWPLFPCFEVCVYRMYTISMLVEELTYTFRDFKLHVLFLFCFFSYFWLCEKAILLTFYNRLLCLWVNGRCPWCWNELYPELVLEHFVGIIWYLYFGLYPGKLQELHTGDIKREDGKSKDQSLAANSAN